MINIYLLYLHVTKHFFYQGEKPIVVIKNNHEHRSYEKKKRRFLSTCTYNIKVKNFPCDRILDQWV